jgi:hypothetical protein
MQSSNVKISESVFVGFGMVCSSTVKKEALCSSETSVDIHRTTSFVSQERELFIILGELLQCPAHKMSVITGTLERWFKLPFKFCCREERGG